MRRPNGALFSSTIRAPSSAFPLCTEPYASRRPASRTIGTWSHASVAAFIEGSSAAAQRLTASYARSERRNVIVFAHRQPPRYGRRGRSPRLTAPPGIPRREPSRVERLLTVHVVGRGSA